MKRLSMLRSVALCAAGAMLLAGCGAGVGGNAGPQLVAATSVHADVAPSAAAPVPASAPAAMAGAGVVRH